MVKKWKNNNKIWQLPSKIKIFDISNSSWIDKCSCKNSQACEYFNSDIINFIILQQNQALKQTFKLWTMYIMITYQHRARKCLNVITMHYIFKCRKLFTDYLSSCVKSCLTYHMLTLSYDRGNPLFTKCKWSLELATNKYVQIFNCKNIYQ